MVTSKKDSPQVSSTVTTNDAGYLEAVPDSRTPEQKVGGRETPDLNAALARAQGELGNVARDSTNENFGSSYASLAAVLTVAREVFPKNGLSWTQRIEPRETGAVLITELRHASGQMVASVYRLRPKEDTPHARGSAISYARRYSLSALLGIAQDDDDGNAGSGL